MQIDEVMTILREECPNAIINERWDTDRWFITFFRVGGNDSSPGYYNDLTNDVLGKINEDSVRKMAGIVNEHFGRK